MARFEKGDTVYNAAGDSIATVTIVAWNNGKDPQSYFAVAGAGHRFWFFENDVRYFTVHEAHENACGVDEDGPDFPTEDYFWDDEAQRDLEYHNFLFPDGYANGGIA